MNAIQTEKLSKYYGKSRGIVDVDLTVEQGDFYGFIGPNGAGKSTTIRTLLGLIAPTSGSARILGLDMVKDRTKVLSKVGYLPSEAAFWSGMKVKEILEFSAALRKTDCRKEAEQLCQRLELDPSKKVGELSLGNRKKISIVCALQHKPELYILDEPTSGLDPLMQKAFYDILTERNREGATVFLSSHVLSEVAKYCRHAGVIREGRLLVSDRVEKLSHTGVKRVCLRGVAEIPALPGMEDIRREQDTVSFLYSGQATELIRNLAKESFADVSITDPELDEVFLHYYQKEDAK